MLLIVSRLTAVLLGTFAYYVAFFMYEDQEGEWQNRVESLWVAINDHENLTGSKASAVFDKVSAVATSVFDRIFGQKLFSFQLIGVSTSYSYASLFLGLSILFTVLFRPARLTAPLPANLDDALSTVKIGCFVIGCIFLLFAALPSLLPSRWSNGLSLLPFLVVLSGLVKLILSHRATGDQLMMFAILIAGILSDVLVLTLIRYTVRRISTAPTLSRVAIAISAQIALITFLVVAPIEASGPLIVKFGNRLMFKTLLWLGVFNLFTGLLASVFLLLLFTVMLHRVTWPILGKLIYPLARYEVLRNHIAMAGIGTACFMFAFPLMPNAIKGILEWLAK